LHAKVAVSVMCMGKIFVVDMNVNDNQTKLYRMSNTWGHQPIWPCDALGKLAKESVCESATGDRDCA